MQRTATVHDDAQSPVEDLDRRQGASPIQNGELTRIPVIRFEPVSRSSRNQSGRDHLARNLLDGVRAQLETEGAALITAPYSRTLARDARHKFHNAGALGR